jgi:hypothetical protein
VQAFVLIEIASDTHDIGIVADLSVCRISWCEENHRWGILWLFLSMVIYIMKTTAQYGDTLMKIATQKGL